MERGKSKADSRSGSLPFLRAKAPALLFLPLLVFLIQGPILAQEQEEQQQEPRQQESPLPSNPGADLLERIKKAMNEIDENLSDASTAGVRKRMEQNVRDLEDLLKDTQQKSSEVISDLEELIQSIKYQKCGSSPSSMIPPEPKEKNQPQNKQEPTSISVQKWISNGQIMQKNAL